MHGERGVLVSEVFPALRARLQSDGVRVRVVEVDLRWGVTESESTSDNSLRICLDQVARSGFFVGMLGERYGHCPPSYRALDDERFGWLREHPAGRSVTELEVQQALLGAEQGLAQEAEGAVVVGASEEGSDVDDDDIKDDDDKDGGDSCVEDDRGFQKSPKTPLPLIYFREMGVLPPGSSSGFGEASPANTGKMRALKSRLLEVLPKIRPLFFFLYTFVTCYFSMRFT